VCAGDPMVMGLCWWPYGYGFVLVTLWLWVCAGDPMGMFLLRPICYFTL